MNKAPVPEEVEDGEADISLGYADMETWWEDDIEIPIKECLDFYNHWKLEKQLIKTISHDNTGI